MKQKSIGHKGAVKMIKINIILILTVCLLSGISLCAGETIADFDFGKPGKEWNIHAKGIFKGTLPEGLDPDFPGWTKSVVKSELIKDGNIVFTRFAVTEFNNAVQFSAGKLRFDNGGIYKLEVVSRGNAPVSVNLRKNDPPYAYYYNDTTQGSLDVFVKSTLYANLGGMPGHEEFKDIRCFLSLKAGVTDILSIKITKVTEGELQASIKRPGKGIANFFRNSRFPLGLQSGWSLDGGFEAGSVEADDSNPGPDGVPSLKIHIAALSASARRTGLFSEPFQTSDPSVQNHISFSYKGFGDWTAVITDNFGRGYLDMSILAKKTLVPSNSWTTVRLDFKPNPMAKSMTIALTGKGGTLWLDTIRAWAGDGDAAYLSQGECEVALAFPISDASIARIQFVDEPAKLKYCITGNVKDAILKSKAVTIYGEDRTLPDIANPGKGEIDFSTALAGRPLGQFRIEAWIEREGKRISPFNEMVVTRVRRPIHWNEDAPSSPFGCHFAASPIIIPMMKAAGINWVRLHDAGTPYIGWYHLEPEKGKWQFRDDAIQRYREWKIKILGDLQTAPLWASSYKGSGKQSVHGYFDTYWTVEDWDGWTNYVKTVCSRYKGIIDGYYVWNEPAPDNGACFLHDSYIEGKGYSLTKTDGAKNQARLCELATKTAKEVDPNLYISGPNINSGGVTGRKFNQAMVDAGSFNYCDFIDYHVYIQTEAGFPGDKLEQNYKELIAPLLDTGFKKPVHMSEGTSGWGIKYEGMYKQSTPWEQDYSEILPASDAICRFVVRLLSLGVERVNLYTANGYSYLGIQPGCFTMLNGDGYPHPALAAYSNMAWQLEDRKFAKCVPVGDKVWAYIFEGHDGMVAVISGFSNGRYTVPNSSVLETCDLFGNPSKGEYKGSLLYVKSKLPLDRLESILAGTL